VRRFGAPGSISVQRAARALEQRATAELIAAGARPRRRRMTSTDALTPAEQRVAEHARQGMTNREIAEGSFVSLRTVETHLTHAYQMLGITKRAELTAALATAAGPSSVP
jgi:DNA-binding CsgD family transcriptional regulator